MRRGLSFIRRWPWAAVLLLGPCMAQDAVTHEPVELDTLFVQYDDATQDEEPGVALMRPRHLRFAATLTATPEPCNTQALQAILDALELHGFLDQAPAGHCIKLRSPGGRELTAWVQDVLVAALRSNAKTGATLDIQADLLAYGVGRKRALNMPLMLVSGFGAQ
jgi:hypothetical protein